MKYISFTKDDDYASRKAAIARQEKLAELLSQMGAQEQAVSTAGGITAPMSGMGALARGLTSFGGSYLSGKAARDAAALDKASRAEAAAAGKELYTMPGTKGQLRISDEDPGVTAAQMEMNMPTLPGQEPSSEKVQYTLDMPNIPGREMGGGARPYEDQQRMLDELDLSDNPYMARMATGARARIEDKRAQAEAKALRDRPVYRANTEYGGVVVNPNTQEVISSVAPSPVKPSNKTPFAAVVNGKPGMFVYDHAGNLVAVPGMTPFRTGGGDGGEPAGPFGGKSVTAQLMNTLIKGNTDSPEYALAYNAISKPRIEFDQATMRPVTIPGMNMDQFPKPSGPVAPGATGITPVVGPAIGETKDVKEARSTLNVFDAQAAKLEEALKGFSTSDKALYASTGVAKGGAAKAIGAYNAMITIIRDPQLINTGVLQQGELRWLNSFLFNPGTIKGMLSGDKATINSFGELRGIIANRLKAKQEVYGTGPAAPGAGGAGGVTPAAAAAELARRNAAKGQ